MKFSPKAFLLCSFLIFHFSLLPALDFGLILNQNLEYIDTGRETEFDYEGIVIPRLSGIWGDTGTFHFALGLNYENDPWAFVPELLQADLFWRSGIMDYRLGRMMYVDPLGFITGGFFDGARVSYDTQTGIFSAGVWYTGLIYKERANIEMTPKEFEQNNTALDFNDFANTYFAPRRLLAALDWEHPGFGARETMAAKMALLGQFDFTGERLHSQYLAGKLTAPVGIFIFDLGGCFELLQNSGDFNTAFAAELGLSWQNPVHRLAFLGRFSSEEFLPINNIAQSQVLSPKLSGVSFVSLDYISRLHRTFSAGLSSFYFMRASPESFPFYNPDGHFLGAEVSGGLYFSPVSDLSINVTGGVFLPSLGNVAPDVNNIWRFDINLILSLY